MNVRKRVPIWRTVESTYQPLLTVMLGGFAVVHLMVAMAVHANDNADIAVQNVDSVCSE